MADAVAHQRGAGLGPLATLLIVLLPCEETPSVQLLMDLAEQDDDTER